MTIDPHMYDDEPWAKLARRYGFEPIHTEAAARHALRHAAADLDAILRFAKEQDDRMESGQQTPDGDDWNELVNLILEVTDDEQP